MGVVRPIHEVVPLGVPMTMALAVLNLLMMGGCEFEVRDTGTLVQSRDSAGVRVSIADWTGGLESADTLILRSPVLRVGVQLGNADYEFDRVISIVPVGSHGFAVADAGRRDVRVFDFEGRLLASYGREGDGPGEFRAMDGAYAYLGDSIAVYDARTDRVTIFDPTSGESRSFVPQNDSESPRTEVLEWL